MACALTGGYTIDCRDGFAGLKEIYLTESANVSTITSASGNITAITMAVGKVFFKYELRKETGEASETITGSIQNGTQFYAQEITLQLDKLKTATRNELKLLAKNTVAVIVKDKNGSYWYYGQTNGLDVTAGKFGTGKGPNDFNGYALTLTGQEPEPAMSVDSTIIAGLL